MSLIGAAVSGLVRSAAGIKEQRTPHQEFIEDKLIPHTLKLQKEAGWRRYKVSFHKNVLFVFDLIEFVLSRRST